jgi:hypothetical protein
MFLASIKNSNSFLQSLFASIAIIFCKYYNHFLQVCTYLQLEVKVMILNKISKKSNDLSAKHGQNSYRQLTFLRSYLES